MRTLTTPRRRKRLVCHATILLAVALVLTAVIPRSASADVTVHVSTVRDVSVQDGECSLREALNYASAGFEADCASGPGVGVVSIVVPAGCFRLANQLNLFPAPLVTQVLIIGSGAGPAGCGGGTVIDAQQNGPVLHVAPFATLKLSGVTLTGGLSCPSVGCDGGGISNGGNLSLDGVTITGNAALAGADQSTPGTGAPGGAGQNGGGIYNLPSGRLTVTNSEIVGNAAGAGGAGADGSNNNGGPGGRGGSGGGIYNAGGTVAVVNSTVSGNSAGAGGTGGLGDPNATPATAGGTGGNGGDGGGIVSVPDISGTGRLTITNSTVAGNSSGAGGGGGLGNPTGAAGTAGGGGGIRASDPALLTNVTVAGNSAAGTGDGIDAAGGALTEYGSVIADNGSGGAAQNCVGAITDDAYNVTFPFEGLSDCPGVVADPKLGPLALNGGAVLTLPLRAGSSAIDIEPPGGACPASDERGIARPQNARCDAGAYESAPPHVANVTATATGPTTATVNADIDPYLQATSVVARYGPTTAYGVASQSVDAGAVNRAVTVNVPLTGLAPNTTYHVQVDATNADGTVTSTDVTLTTAAGPSSGGAGSGGSTAPVITNARQSVRRWLPGRTLATFTRRHALPVGTTFTFELDQTATVTLTFTRMAQGRLVKRHCLAPSRRNQHRPTCTRDLAAGALIFAAHAGTNHIRFYGQLSRRAQLTPGNYAVDISAINGAGLSSLPQRLRFTIARP